MTRCLKSQTIGLYDRSLNNDGLDEANDKAAADLAWRRTPRFFRRTLG